jgi:hypothetical protein
MFKQIQIPLEIVSEANRREHWAVSHQRHKRQKECITYHLMMHNISRMLPVAVTMTRCSPRSLDDDNLVMAFKYIRDAISEYLIFNPLNKKGIAPGRADSDPRIKWIYFQEKNHQRGVKVAFEWSES